MEENNLIKQTENNIADNAKSDKKTNITMHKDVSLQKLNYLLTGYIKSSNDIDKADKLSYWLEDYCKFLNFEKRFNPNMLQTYKRGNVIKVNLGYNVGNEEGGLHYCIVVDRNNYKSSGVITVIPLTSDKGKKVHFSSVCLGNEIYNRFLEKAKHLQISLSNTINSFNKSNIQLEEVVEALDNLKILKKSLQK